MGLTASCLQGKILLYDAADAEQPFRIMRFRKRKACVACGEDAALDIARRYETPCMLGSATSASGNEALEFSASTLAARLKRGEPTCIVDVRQRNHFEVAHL